VSRNGGSDRAVGGGVIGAGKLEGKRNLQRPECVLEELEKTPGVQKNCTRAQAGAGATAACVAAAAELGQELCDVETARAGQHEVSRAAAQLRDDTWDVGRQEVARKTLRWRVAAMCSSGRWRATWPSKEGPAREQEAAGQRSGRHVHARRVMWERQRRRTWPGSGGGVRQRRNRGGREGGRRRGEKCRDLNVIHQ
jgi:hypothetical protein